MSEKPTLEKVLSAIDMEDVRKGLGHWLRSEEAQVLLDSIREMQEEINRLKCELAMTRNQPKDNGAGQEDEQKPVSQ